jgi:hypothetical protein
MTNCYEHWDLDSFSFSASFEARSFASLATLSRGPISGARLSCKTQLKLRLPKPASGKSILSLKPAHYRGLVRLYLVMVGLKH